MADIKDISFKTIADSIKNGAADLLSSSDFISRTIGMNNSYEDIMFIVQSLGREPISLLGKDYAFIYDHVRRNYLQGTYVNSKDYDGCYKFTFYKEAPTVRFANPYEDPMNLKDRWFPDVEFETTSVRSYGAGTSVHYSESNNASNNIKIAYQSDLEHGNPGTATNSITSFGPKLTTCDLIKKTNDNFNHGKYDTLIARFHTDSQDSKSYTNSTQTAISREFGMSHGRNLLAKDKITSEGYDNPYCRTWTYHYQYNQIARQIRPFKENSQELLEKGEISGNYDTVGFRTSNNDAYDFEGGSKRLDRHGVLNYYNGTVNIAPTAKIKDYFDGKQSDYDKKIIETKKCMFSIENLAWKDDKNIKSEYDPNGLSPEQKGPLGGRIMWFPPYDLSFNESVNVNWNANQFIGRGEKVYTYTDTERTGNLNFTLLIDHPSILDYWTGHERNGMKNQGKRLDIGNSGGVDNKDNQENTLLRFFAGCDILTAKPQEYRVKLVKPNDDSKEEEKEDVEITEPEVTKSKERKKICTIVYFPNNYSGKDDRNGIVNPIHYLMNGVGTQRRYNEVYGKDEDFQVDMNNKVTVDNVIVGGYEMSNVGISIVKDNLQEDVTIIEKSYVPNTMIQYLTDKFGNPKEYFYNENNKGTLTKMIIPIAMPREAILDEHGNISENVTGTRHLWYRKRYYYRVDKSNTAPNYQESHNFSNPLSYIDAKSYSLNWSGFTRVRDNKVANSFGIEDDSTTYKLVSFSDLFTAIEGNTVIEPINKDDVELIKNIFKDHDRYSNVKISLVGHASFQGYEKSNDYLAKNRALTLQLWLEDFLGSSFKINTLAPISQSKETVTDTGQVDDELVKIWRSASIVIEYDEENVSDAATNESTKIATDDDGNPILDEDNNTVTRVEKIEVKNKETSKNNIITTDDWLHNTPEGKAMLAAHPEIAALSMSDIERLTGKNYTNPNDWNNFDNSLLKDDSFKQDVVRRYDNEGEFFEVLDKESPFLHNLITDKIKYFDPAYHSISPEGFNARLTFLHQCTRQGSTVENSSFDSSTAYNLAFGRPPVCVLRLGDFYYTKIVITSMDIQYEQPQWDMNPEGIGMMPMFAKIGLRFNFLGGSDLAGPIARLQNAVSFNYYANTSVYDDRAEMVEYDPNGSGREIKFKGYTYPKRDGLVKVGDVTITDSLNYDENRKTNWEGRTYIKGDENE